MSSIKGHVSELYWSYIGAIYYRDNGKENGNYYLGFRALRLKGLGISDGSLTAGPSLSATSFKETQSLRLPKIHSTLNTNLVSWSKCCSEVSCVLHALKRGGYTSA